MCNSFIFQTKCRDVVALVYAMFVYFFIFSEQTKIPQIQLLALFLVIYYYFKTFLARDETLFNQTEEKVVEDKNNNWSPIHLDDFDKTTIKNKSEDESPIPIPNPDTENNTSEITGNSKESQVSIDNTKTQEKNVEEIKQQSNWFCCGSLWNCFGKTEKKKNK
jgi:hypothetical protein